MTAQPMSEADANSFAGVRPRLFGIASNGSHSARRPSIHDLWGWP
jgi:hypothetical protein